MNISPRLIFIFLMLIIPKLDAAVLSWEDAYNLVKEKHYHEALESVQLHAKDGNHNAQYILALMYQHGKGVQASPQQASNWYYKAIVGNNAEVMFDYYKFLSSKSAVLPEASEYENTTDIPGLNLLRLIDKLTSLSNLYGSPRSTSVWCELAKDINAPRKLRIDGVAHCRFAKQNHFKLSTYHPYLEEFNNLYNQATAELSNNDIKDVENAFNQLILTLETRKSEQVKLSNYQAKEKAKAEQARKSLDKLMITVEKRKNEELPHPYNSVKMQKVNDPKITQEFTERVFKIRDESTIQHPSQDQICKPFLDWDIKESNYQQANIFRAGFNKTRFNLIKQKI